MATLEAVAAVLGTVQKTVEKMDEKLDTVVIGQAKTETMCADTQKDMEDMRAYCLERSGKISERIKVVENTQTADKAFRNGKRAGETMPAWMPTLMKILALLLAGAVAGLGGPEIFKAIAGM